MAMSNSIDTFQLYIESLDSSGRKVPTVQVESVPSEDVDAFDTSYVDKVIFGGGLSGGDLNADPDYPLEGSNSSSNNEDNEEDLEGFASFRSEEVLEIDSGLNSPENGVGSYKRPQFLKVNSFMIWNDPDQAQTLQSQTPEPEGGVTPGSELSDSFSGGGGITFTAPSSSPVPNSMNMKTMKKRGLFSRSATTGGGSSSSSSGNTANNNELEVSLSESKSLKSPNSPNNSTTTVHNQLNSSASSATVGSSGGGGATIVQQELDEDRFNGDGVQFHGKLIGHEYVAEARGEQMCQQSLKKLKIIQKAMGGHKRRIHLYISFDGIKIQDALTSEQLFHHTVPQISFISRDETDTRAFGYVFGNSTTGHQFIGIKTKKEAMVLMSTIGQLFAITLKRKRSAEEAAALAAAAGGTSDSAATNSATAASEHHQSADDHMYHSVYDLESATSGSSATGLNRSLNRRSRTSSTNENVPIPALPPPTNDHRGHHRAQLAPPNTIQTVKLTPPTLATSSSSQNPSSNSLFNEMDMFAQFEPQPNVTNHVGKSPKLSSSYDWANFDDDGGNSSNQSVAAPPSAASIIDDSTLNTISSISDTMNLAGVSGGAGVGTGASSSRTLSQNDQTTTSATLVARYNQKNHPKNSSSSTIASTNFDGADPFSDAFGSDDPFSGSMTVGGVATVDLSGSLGASNLNKNDFNSVPTLSNQFGSLALDKSAGSFKSNLELSNSLNKSTDSTTSADRYAALQDIHNLSNSIFDSFGNKKTDVRRGSNQQANQHHNKSSDLFRNASASAAIPITTAQQQSAQLFSSGSFNQGSTFHASPSQFATTTNVSMYGQSPSQYQQAATMYQQGGFVPGSSPMMMNNATNQPMMIATVAQPTTSQMYQQQYPGGIVTVALPPQMQPQNSLVHSAQWSAASTSSLPNSFGDPMQQQHQQQHQFMPGTSPIPGYNVAMMQQQQNGYNVAMGGGAMPNGMLLRNPMQGSSASLFATPPIAAQSFSSNSSASNQFGTSNGSLNKSSSDIPLFQDLDPLNKNKPRSNFLSNQNNFRTPEPMFQQQQSLDSFSRNNMAPAISIGNSTVTNPFL